MPADSKPYLGFTQWLRAIEREIDAEIDGYAYRLASRLYEECTPWPTAIAPIKNVIRQERMT